MINPQRRHCFIIKSLHGRIIKRAVYYTVGICRRCVAVARGILHSRSVYDFARLFAHFIKRFAAHNNKGVADRNRRSRCVFIGFSKSYAPLEVCLRSGNRCFCRDYSAARTAFCRKCRYGRKAKHNRQNYRQYFFKNFHFFTCR